MEELKAIFGEESLDYATFEQRIADNGIELGNLAGKKYVATEKYSKLQREFDKYKSENDVSKYADYEDVKAERDALRAEKADNELAAQVTAAGVDAKFRKFVLAEVKGLVTDTKDFAACLADYLKENAQFIEQPKPQTSFFRGGTSVNVDGDISKKSTNQKMNEFIKGAIKK